MNLPWYVEIISVFILIFMGIGILIGLFQLALGFFSLLLIIVAIAIIVEWGWIGVLALLGIFLVISFFIHFVASFFRPNKTSKPITVSISVQDRSQQTRSVIDYKPADFMSWNEKKFFYALHDALGKQYYIMANPRVIDVITPAVKKKSRLFKHLSRKVMPWHFDYVLLDRTKGEHIPVACAIELDDSSHKQKDVQYRDAYKDKACKSAGVCLIRYQSKGKDDKYDPNEIKEFIINKLKRFEMLKKKESEITQTLELVDRRWTALVNGEKIDTIRLNEGTIKEGLLRYIACDDKSKTAYVYVTSVKDIPLKDVPNEPNKEDFLERMRMHYPDITLDTVVSFIEHLSVPETLEKYGDLIPIYEDKTESKILLT